MSDAEPGETSVSLTPTTRRALFRRSAGLAALGGIALVAGGAAAAGKISKTTVSYQYTPKGANHCSLCASFIPGPDAGPGTCKVVDGPIQPLGWCIAFSPKR
jgi:hypothetical protein